MRARDEPGRRAGSHCAPSTALETKVDDTNIRGGLLPQAARRPVVIRAPVGDRRHE